MPFVDVETSSDVLARFPGAAKLLTDLERERAAAFVFPADSETFIAAHVLVRICAARALNTEPERLTLVQTCPTCGLATHGRPSIKEAPELAVSLSHSRGYVAACAGSGPLGIDVEVVSRGADLTPIVRALAPGEAALVQAAPDPGLSFLDLWVRKEALIKAGQATLDTLDEIDLSGDPTRWGDLHIAAWRDERGVMVGVVSPDPYVRPT